MQSKINVVIVDDQALVRHGIKGLLEKNENIAVVKEASNGLEIINWFKEKPADLEIDIVLMDMQMPELNGWDTADFLIKKFPDLKILGLSSYNNEAFVDRLIANGGRGYLLKTQEIEDVVQAIEEVIKIGYYFSSQVSLNQISDFIKTRRIKPFYSYPRLTEREVNVLLLICKEKTTQQISQILFISNKTVETHRVNIMSKIGAKNMVGLAMYAIKHKLLEID
jgi:DNA-binding NarL/FixJ family response regulator